MNKESLILIIGAGSIGERHIRNLWQLGYHNIIVYRQRNLPFRDIGEAKVKVCHDLEEAKKLNPEVAFICTPTSQHLKQSIYCLQNDMHVFVEKPLSDSTADLKILKNIAGYKNKLLQVGFMMRFHPHILAVKNIITEKTFGELLISQSHWGSYLPAWHEYENYKEGYAANKSLGGGVALTLCHDIDIAIWLSSKKIINYKSVLTKSEQLDIDVPSIADIEIIYNNGGKSSIQLNFLDYPPLRWYKWEFERALIHLDFFNNQLKITQNSKGGTEDIKILEKFDRNDMFIDELKSFFYNINNLSSKSEYSLNQITESETIIAICN